MSKETINIGTVMDVKGSQKSLNDLRKEIDGSRDALEQLNEGTQEYSEELKRLAEAETELANIRQQNEQYIDNMVDGLSGVTDAVGGVMGGFSALQGILTLVGEENEDLVNTMVKLQSAMAVVQGIKSFGEGIKGANVAMKAFNITVKSNPIMLMASALITTTALVYAFTRSTDNSKEAIDKLDQSYKNWESSMSITNRENKHTIELLKAQGKSIDEVIRKEKEHTREAIKETQARIDAKIAEIEMYSRMGNVNKEVLEKLKEQSDMLLDTRTKLQIKLNDLNKKQEVEEVRSETNKAERLKAERIKNAEESAKLREAQNQNEIRLQEQLNATIEQLIEDRDARDRESLYNGLTTNKERLELIDKELISQEKLANDLRNIILDDNSAIESKIEATRKLIDVENDMFQLSSDMLEFEKEKAEVELEIRELLKPQDGEINSDDPEELMALLEVQREVLAEEMNMELDKANNIALSYEIRLEAVQKYNEMLSESQSIEERLGKASIQIEDNKQAAQMATLKVTSNALKSAGAIIGETTALGKSMAIASATIDTYQSAVGAYKAMASIPIVGPSLGIAAASTAIATGLQNVKAITSTQVPGNNVGGAATPSIAQPTFEEPMPDVQQTYTRIDSNDLEVLNRDQRVYVLEEDITNAQRKVSVAEGESTF